MRGAWALWAAVFSIGAACNRSPVGSGHAVGVAPAPPAPSAKAATSSAMNGPSSAAPASSGPPAPTKADFRRAVVSGRPPRPIELHGGGKRAVSGEHGVVTSVEAQATRAGIRILEAGGNAVDAAIGVAYALAVTHPSAGNIGGGGFMLVRPPGGPTVAIDFRETAPAALTRERFDKMIHEGAVGPAAVGVPGSVAGLNLAHERFGRLSMQRVIAPAIALARDGFRLGDRQATTLVWSWPELKKDRAARAEFGDGDGTHPKKAGAELRRPELAKTLERIRDEGEAGFYRGKTAERIVAGLGKRGLLTLDDFASYRAELREPLRFTYRGLQVETMPPPSSGGVAIAQTLLMLEALGAERLERDSAEELHLFIEASRRAQAEKRFAVADPASLGAAKLAERLRSWSDPEYLLARAPTIDPLHATPSREVNPLFDAAMRELEHTTHLSVVDSGGMVVSLTTTLSAGFGAKIVAPGTGIVLNNSVAAFGTAGDSQPAPGRRTTSSMAPTIVLENGKPLLVLGTPGGDTIPSTICQVLRNVVDYGMPLDEAIDAPRIHHGFAPDEVRYEKARPIKASTLKALEKLGQHISKMTTAFGDANDVFISGRTAYAYADPREGGLALAAAAKR